MDRRGDRALRVQYQWTRWGGRAYHSLGRPTAVPEGPPGFHPDDGERLRLGAGGQHVLGVWQGVLGGPAFRGIDAGEVHRQGMGQRRGDWSRAWGESVLFRRAVL